MSKKDRSKAILKELRALRGDLESRLDDLGERLAALEGGRAGDPGQAARPGGGLAAVPRIKEPVPRAEDALHPTERDVTVTVTPLNDVSLARVVESALNETEGVESAVLRELKGDSALLDVRAEGDAALITGLRRTLPVAFDVTESDKDSFTIALAQPGADVEGGVAAPDST